MATVNYTRTDLDPYFTVTWPSMNPGDVGQAFECLNDELLTVELVSVSSTNPSQANLFGSLQTFIPGNSPVLAPLSGIDTVFDLRSVPKVGWIAPSIPTGASFGCTLAVLFKTVRA